MPNLISISSTEHKDLRVNPASSLMPQSNTDEFSRLSAQYPLVFVKHEDTGKFVCTALMGLNEGENLFIDGNELNAFCLPLNLARQPFFLGLGENESEDDIVVCIDMDHPCVNTENGDRIFDEKGEQAKLLQDSCSILATLYHGEKNTVGFVEQLISLDLLTPITLSITYNDQSKSQIDGLYTIDEDKLVELDGESLKSMNEKKYLSAAYTMLVSLGQIQS